jgi:hypothetical protein
MIVYIEESRSDYTAAQAALVSIEERRIEFFGESVPAYVVEVEGEAQLYIPIKPLSDQLQLSWSGQSERLRRDPILSDQLVPIRTPRAHTRGGNPLMMALPLRYARLWLIGIGSARVHPSQRLRLIAYQQSLVQLLDGHSREQLIPDWRGDAGVTAALQEVRIRATSMCWLLSRDTTRSVNRRHQRRDPTILEPVRHFPSS